VFLEIENSEKNRLGMPLPKGVVRVYKADKSGSTQFIGEDRIDHTPRDEKITIKVGDAFDVLAQEKETEFHILSKCATESDWEITVWNHKDTKVEVEVDHDAPEDWEILRESQKHEKKDAHTFTFTPEIKPRGEVKITFRVRTRWC
jgi:hypothetical protein